MNNQELHERADKLLDRLDASASWRNIGMMWHFGRDPQPPQLAVERICLLLGPQQAELAAGEVSDDDGLKGWMLVITEDRLIYADVWPSDNSRGPRVEAISLDAVYKVSVDFVQAQGLADSPWPSTASVKLHLSQALCDVTEITVGADYRSARVLADEIAQTAGRLPLPPVRQTLPAQ